MVQADASAPAVSENVIRADAKRPYSLFEIEWRLSGIRATVRALTANGELSDYDDEMATDLRMAAEFLEQLLAAYKAAATAAIAKEIAIRNEAIAEAAKIAEGWPVHASGDDYQTSGNGRFWTAGNVYDQARIDAAFEIRSLAHGADLNSSNEAERDGVSLNQILPVGASNKEGGKS